MVALHLSNNPHQLPEADIREPITAIISRVVRPGKESDYETWAEGITRACADFDGYMGTDLIRPADHAHPEYVTIFRFDNYPHLRTWQESDTVRDWLARVRPLIVRESELHLQRGLEVWFTQQRPTQPDITKISLVTWIALTPLVLIVPPVLMPYLTWMPEPLAVTLVTGVNVAFMAYPVMPLMTRLFRGWLYPEANPTVSVKHSARSR